jgi:hypothetical protein
MRRMNTEAGWSEVARSFSPRGFCFELEPDRPRSGRRGAGSLRLQSQPQPARAEPPRDRTALSLPPCAN